MAVANTKQWFFHTLGMETTRHFTATTYIINEGATALHKHDRLDMWLPPGGHIQRDELPHEAALREVREETGLTVELVQSASGPASATARPLPQPATILLEDITVHPDGVSHQHIDFIYYALSPSRTIDPKGGDETPAGAWEWLTIEDLRTDNRFDRDVKELGIDAIESVAVANRID